MDHFVWRFVLRHEQNIVRAIVKMFESLEHSMKLWVRLMNVLIYYIWTNDPNNNNNNRIDFANQFGSVKFSPNIRTQFKGAT